MVCNIITADKANRLFWLGRYAERVYISLHLLRRYYDRVLDGNISNINEYYTKLGVYCHGKDIESLDFQLAQLYDRNNICSIVSSIDCANDNAIMLRRDITSESLSYIQMSKVLIEECAESQQKNITMLQPITDYMLAFFGSIDERVFDKNIRNFLKAGKLIENLDLHIRFDYPFFRIEEVYYTLKEFSQYNASMLNNTAIHRLDEMLTQEKYDNQTENYKEVVLDYLNYIIKI